MANLPERRFAPIVVADNPIARSRFLNNATAIGRYVTTLTEWVLTNTAKAYTEIMRHIVPLILCLSSATVSADDLVITEKSFGCVLELPKVRNTRIQNSDLEKLKEAIRIFRDSVPEKEYPTGTILQLIPTEAMVKHDRAAFPNTNGWEFFALKVSPDGTTIQDRGDKVLNTSLKKPCLDCHSPAAKFDFVCEKGHGCAPIPVTDQQIAAMQAADPRCKK